MRGPFARYVFWAVVLAGGLLIVALAGLSFWWSAHDYFDYNAVGTVDSVVYCKAYDKTEWASESIGRISVSFQLLGDNVTYEDEIFTPEICSLYSCCRSLVGKQVYFKVKAESDGNYTAVDLSYGKVQDSVRWTALGILLLTLTGVCAACVLIGATNKTVQEKPADKVELLENGEARDTDKLDEVD